MGLSQRFSRSSRVALALLLAVAAGLGGINHYSFLPPRDYVPRDRYIVDVRARHHSRHGLLSPTRQWPQVLRQPEQPPPRSYRTGSIGRASLENRDRHIIDTMALAEPFLARLPAIHREDWHIGHHSRYLPTDYFNFVVGRADTIVDESLRGLLQDVELATRAPVLFSSERLAAIWRLNSGHYARLDLRRYQDPASDIPIVSRDACLRAWEEGYAWLDDAAPGTPKHIYNCIPIPLSILELPPKADGHAFNAKDVPLRFYGRALIVADPPRPATALQLSISHMEDYEIRVNGELVATINRVSPEGKLQNYRLPLPGPMTIEEVEIRALGRHWNRAFSVGHLLIR